VATEVRRDLQRQADVAVAQAPLQLGVIAQRRLLQEVARAGEVALVLLAGGGLVAVEHGEGQVLDVQADAVTDDEQQQYRTEQGHAAADRVAAQFQRLAAGVAEQAAQAEALALRGWRLLQRRRAVGWLLADRLLQVGDEGGF